MRQEVAAGASTVHSSSPIPKEHPCAPDTSSPRAAALALAGSAAGAALTGASRGAAPQQGQADRHRRRQEARRPAERRPGARRHPLLDRQLRRPALQADPRRQPTVVFAGSKKAGGRAASRPTAACSASPPARRDNKARQASGPSTPSGAPVLVGDTVQAYEKQANPDGEVHVRLPQDAEVLPRAAARSRSARRPTPASRRPTPTPRPRPTASPTSPTPAPTRSWRSRRPASISTVAALKPVKRQDHRRRGATANGPARAAPSARSTPSRRCPPTSRSAPTASSTSPACPAARRTRASAPTAGC